MKKPVFIAVVMALIAGCLRAQNFTQQDMVEIKPFLGKGINAVYDEHEGILWISSEDIYIDQPDSYSSISVSMKLYFGLRKYNDQIRMTPLRLMNEIQVPEWVFFNQISFLYGTLAEKRDGTRKKFQLTDMQTDTEVLRNGLVRETSDVAIYEDMTELIRLMISEPKPLDIRYSGDEKYYERFHAVRLKEFSKRFGPVIQAFDKMTQKFEMY